MFQGQMAQSPSNHMHPRPFSLLSVNRVFLQLRRQLFSFDDESRLDAGTNNGPGQYTRLDQENGQPLIIKQHVIFSHSGLLFLRGTASREHSRAC
jgi:hypothetical protein